MAKTEKGSCLCGAVQFECERTERGIGVCHCKACRRQNTGPIMVVRTETGVRLTNERGIKWYESSDIGRRGFCAECGSTLFYTETHRAPTDWSVSVGALDDAVADEIYEHIYVDMQPDYYAFTDGKPRRTEAQLKTPDAANH